MTWNPLITVITPTTAAPCVLRAIESVQRQTYGNIQHLVVIDRPDASSEIRTAIRATGVDVIELPYATGKDRFNGHRIYGAMAYIAKGDYICYLDDDNWYDPDHVESLLDVVRRGFSWAFSLRKIVDIDGAFICNDDCESLGLWPTIVNENDFHIDTSCYFLPKSIAVQSSPIWYRRWREPGVIDPDRALVKALRQQGTRYHTSGRYSMNYRAGNTAVSVRSNFFLEGNQKMLAKLNGALPWRDVKLPPLPLTPNVTVSYRMS